jgi:hypothetical protein
MASLLSDQANQPRSSDQPTDKTSADTDIATRWQQEIVRYEKWAGDWTRKCNRILKLYARQKADVSKKRKFAMLWSNTEVLKPSVYSRPPVPQISRRYKDKDKIGRVASELLERSVTVALDLTDLDSRLKHIRDDLLLPGRGTMWLRTESDADGQLKLVTDYVQWRDFGHTPARVWEEVTAVWKWSYQSRDQIKQRFGKEIAQGISYDHKETSDQQIAQADDSSRGIEPKAAIAEIWDKTSNKVYFISKNYDKPLEVSEPFLNLSNFWPCPKPVFATLTNENLIPTPDYTYYRDQAEEIDDLTARIASLTDGLKLVGFYPAGKDQDVQQAIERALNPNVENVMIPVESWAAFVEGGGGKSVVFLPIADVVATVQACIQLRTQLISDVYQVSGISDVLRGSTDPNETATAQSLKAQWGSIRIRDRQQEMARFARDVVRIAAEIMAENFDFNQLRAMANMMPAPMQPAQPLAPAPQPPMSPDMSIPAQPMASGMPTQPQQAQSTQQMAPQGDQDWDESLMPQVEQLLKSDKLRSFRIDIETDSTIQPDEDAEKQRRVEFLEAVSTFMQQSLPMLQMFGGGAAPFMGECLLFLTRGFRAGRSLEDVIERTVAQLGQMPPPQAQQGSDPSQIAQAKAAVDMQTMQGKAQIDQQSMMNKAQIAQQTAQQQANVRGQELTQDFIANQANRQAEMQHETNMMHMQQQAKLSERDMAIRHAAHQALLKRETMGGPQGPGTPRPPGVGM